MWNASWNRNEYAFAQLAALLLAAGSCFASIDEFEIRIAHQPSRLGFGGVSLDEQPVVRLWNSTSSAFEVSPFGNNTWVIAYLWLPPNRFAILSGGDDGLAQQLESSHGVAFASQYRVAARLNESGFANFSGIAIDMSSTSPYQLNFFIFGQGSVPGAISNGIEIRTGPAYRLSLLREPGTADGGRPFRAYPYLEVVDAGGNRVTSDSSTVARASISAFASVANASRTPVLLGRAEATARRGLIEFLDLGIDAAGLGYVLDFNSNADRVHPLGQALGNSSYPGSLWNGTANSTAWFDGVSEDRSNVSCPPFTVGVGPTASLRLVQQPGGGRGGEAFDGQPKVLLLDAGGNINTQDNDSFVTAEIYDNGAFPRRRDASGPGHGRLGPIVLYDDFVPDPSSLDLEVLASVLQGQVYVNVTGGIPTAFTPPLESGDQVSLGSVSQPDHRQPDYLSPPPNEPGAIVRVVRADESRFRLDSPWQYNDTFLQPLLRTRDPVRVRVQQGVADFTGLQLDRVGRAYTLRFVSSLRPEPEGTLLGRGRRGYGRQGYGYGYGLDAPDGTPSLPLAPNGGDWEAALAGRSGLDRARALPNITVVSEPFDVAVGAPASIVVSRQAQGAWAGGQPFRVQPRVEVLDLGGNTVLHDNETVITVSLASNASGALLPGTQAGVAPSPYSSNELSGLLRGNTSSRVVDGVLVFQDLAIDVPGKDFALLFTAQLSGGGGTYSAASPVRVAPSAEFQVLPFDGEPGDQFGSAVAAGNNYLAVGAPRDSAPQQEVQVIRTEASATEYVREVQVVTTTAARQDEVQAVGLLTPTRGGITGGFFQLQWKGLTSRYIPHDAHGDLVKVIMEADFAGVGIGDVAVREVGVDRTPAGTSLSLPDGADVADQYGLCALLPSSAVCRADRLWLVTFKHLAGFVPLLQVDNGSFAIAGPNVTHSVAQVQPSSRIGGFFSLQIGGYFGGQLNQTVDIAHDAHPATVKDAIVALGTGPVDVSRAPGVLGEEAGSFAWAVTFSASPLDPFSYNPPTLVANSSGLSGPYAAAYVHTSRQGEGPLHGSFRLFFRGEGPTAPIQYDATAQEMRDALETLPTIDLIDVLRSGPTLTGGFAWTVTFQLTRTETDEGFELDQGLQLAQDLPPIADSEIGASAVPYRWVPPGDAAPDAMLAGSQARVTVDHVFGESRDDPWEAPRSGLSGAGAGAVYVFRRFGRAWYPDGGDAIAPGDPAANELSRIRPSDTDGQDAFGSALAMDETQGVIAVGAPAAAFYGGLEVQRVACAADTGSFTLTWRGRTTAAIPPATSISAVKAALEDLASLHAVSVSGESTDGGSGPVSSEQPVCGGTATGANAMLVTFLWPQDGDLPPLEPDAALLGTSGADPVVLSVDDDVVRGERVSSGENATGLSVGAVYLFGRGSVSNGGGGWAGTHKLLAPAEHRGAGSGFGTALSASGDTVVVGAPLEAVELTGEGAGSVYVFRRSDLLDEPHSSNASWSLTQRVVARTSNSEGGADHGFGSAVALDGESLVVGAPGAEDGQGRVYVFKRKLWISDQFLIDQVLVAPTEARLFGHAVAAADDLVVVGAPESLHPMRLRALLRRSGPLGPEAQPASVLRTGAAYVYDRDDFFGFYSSAPRSELAPSGAYEGDRAGLSVGVSGHVAVVGTSRLTQDAARPRHEVQVVMLDAEEGPMSREWRLQWRRERRSTDPRAPTRPTELGVNPKDSKWVLRSSRPLAVDATASQVREVLEYDLGTGAVNVTRKGPDTQGGYRWFVTFLALGGDSFGPGGSAGPMVGGPVSGSMAAGAGRAAAGRAALSASGPVGAWSPLGGGQGGSAGALGAAVAANRHAAALRGSIAQAPVPLLEMDVSRVRGKEVRGTVARVSSASLPAPGAAFVFARDPATGSGAPWVEAGAFAPHGRQRSDYFGRAVSVAGAFAAVGAPNRDSWPSGTNAGAALAFDLGLLNLRIDGAGPPPPTQVAGGTGTGVALAAGDGYHGLAVDEDGMALRMRVRHCRPLSACAVPGALAVAREAAAAQPLAGPGFGANETMAVLLDVTAGDDLGHHVHWAREAVLDPSRAYAGLPSVLRASGAIALASSSSSSSSSSSQHGSQGSGDAFSLDIAAATRAPATATAGCALWVQGAPEAEAHEACRFLSLPGPLLRSSGPDFAGSSDAEPVLRREVLVAVPPEDFNGSLPDPEPLDSLADADNSTELLSEFDALVSVRVSDDRVLEAPDESLHVRASLPGFEPSEGGPLWSQATIEDDGDGAVGSRGYLSRVFADDGMGQPPAGADFGRSVSLEGSLMAVGAPRYSPGQDPGVDGYDATAAMMSLSLAVLNGSDNEVLRANGSLPGAALGAARVDGPGRAYVFRQVAGLWSVEAELSAPNGTEFYAPGARFGSGVSVAPGGAVVAVTSSGGGGARESIALHVFARNASGNVSVQLLASLRPDPSQATAYDGRGALDSQTSGLEALRALGHQGVLPQHGFGLARAVASTADRVGEGVTVVVGCRGMEAVFVFRGTATDAASWRQTAVLTSSAHRAQRHALRYYFVPEGFGAAVAASGNTVVVGAPHANYGGSQRVGAGSDSRSQAESFEQVTGFFGTGGVYVFELVLGAGPDAGYGGLAGSWANATDWAGGDELLRLQLQQQAGGGSGGGAGFRVINDTGGDLSNASISSAIWAQQALLLASDGRPGDRFGASVDVDGSQLIAGAWGSGAQPRTTWNFETAGLEGWYATGTAFASQPTHGDNPSFRPVYTTATGAPGLPQRSGLEGHYFIGTFEGRPGDPADPLAAPSALPGTVQGDAPQGTLTSDPFVIAGKAISMLVGGGCDARAVFVELLVDGDPVRRATGACEEQMARVHWDVGAYAGRAGVIRIADHSSGKWGHINVDDIRFSWAMQRYKESPRSGAAYAFRRQAPGTSGTDGEAVEPCSAPADGRSALACEWAEQGKLMPSDKRAGVQFALDVAVVDAAGVAIVAAARPHGPSSSDWHLPGSIAGVRLGLFGHSEGSARADGGINAVVGTAGDATAAAAAGYDDLNVWGGQHAALVAAARAEGLSPVDIGLRGAGSLSPFLRNVGSSRGGRSAVGLQEIDGSGFTGLFGGAGVGGTSGLRFDAGGSGGPPAGPGVAAGGGASFDGGDPFVRVDPATGDSYRLQAEGTFPGSAARALRAEASGAGLGTGVAMEGVLSSGLGGAGAGVPSWGRLGSSPPEGLLYVFRREPEKRGGGRGSVLVQAPRWAPGTEAARVALPWSRPGDGLGASVAASGFQLAAGAPQDSQLFPGAGSLAVLDSEFTRLGFEQEDFRLDRSRGAKLDFASQTARSAQLGREFPSNAVQEGDYLGFIVVPVFRYGLESEIQSTLHVQYTTRDVTAFGVPGWKADACEAIPRQDRSKESCGDYVQTEGVLVFAPGQRRRDIVVRIVDDSCYEPQAELFALHLASPGGAGLLGHGYTTTVRIDDDDSTSGRDSCATLADGLGTVDASLLETYPGLYASESAHAAQG